MANLAHRHKGKYEFEIFDEVTDEVLYNIVPSVIDDRTVMAMYSGAGQENCILTFKDVPVDEFHLACQSARRLAESVNYCSFSFPPEP
jgi:hypothetical protein